MRITYHMQVSLVMVTAGKQDQATLPALDKQTGKPSWKLECKRFHRNWTAAYRWLRRIAACQRALFVHGQVRTPPKGWAGRAG